MNVGLHKRGVLTLVDVTHTRRRLESVGECQLDFSKEAQCLAIGEALFIVGDVLKARWRRRVPVQETATAEGHPLKELSSGFLIQAAQHEVEHAVEITLNTQLLGPSFPDGVLGGKDAIIGVGKVARQCPVVFVLLNVGDGTQREIADFPLDFSIQRPALVGVVEILAIRIGQVIGQRLRELVVSDRKVVAAGNAPCTHTAIAAERNMVVCRVEYIHVAVLTSEGHAHCIARVHRQRYSGQRFLFLRGLPVVAGCCFGKAVGKSGGNV